MRPDFMLIRLTRVVKIIVITCFAAFLVQQTIDRFYDGHLLDWLGLRPAAVIFEHKLWQLVTYAFLHLDVMHLVLNLLVLVFLGGELEAVWGSSLFLRFYLFCAVAAGGLYLVLQAVFWGAAGLQVPMVGASGAIYGLLLAYGLVFGERVLLFMMLFPLKAKHFVWILAGVEFLSGVYSGQNGLSNMAHLGGMAGGLIFLWVRARWRICRAPNVSRRSVRKTQGLGKKGAASHLRLVVDRELDGPKQKEDEKPKIWH